MKRLKKLVSDYFGFPPKETRGFLVLSVLIIVILSLSALVGKIDLEDRVQYEKDRKKLDSLIALIEKQNSLQPEMITVSKATLFSFDPNTASLDELEKLGIPKKIGSIIINYRNKGGTFRVKGDLKRIYGISDQLFSRLYPHIDLPEEQLKVVTTSYSKDEREHKPFVKPIEIKSFDINKADSVELKMLKGIGPKLSARIINFRDKLGGFVDEKQLEEIYGLDSSLVLILKEKTFIEQGFSPRKIKINSATLDELKIHPYLRYKLAQLIISYRNQHGEFKDLNDLKNIKALSEKDFNKIIPYLEL
jgi:DNA uptake protein ComE-like DNA-binding protein